MHDFRVRPYRKGDEAGIISLYNDVFSQDRTIEQWRWEFIETPGRQSIIYVICYKDRIIGHFAIMPLHMQYKNEKILAGKAEGAAIHKDFRFLSERKQLFKQAVDKSVQTAQDRGIGLIWGLTNIPRDFTRVGFKNIGAVYSIRKELSLKLIMKGYVRGVLKRTDFKRTNKSTNKIPICHLKSSSPPYLNYQKRRFRVEEVPVFGEEIDNVYKNTGQKDCITLIRGKEYLNWRFARNSSHNSTMFIVKKDHDVIGYLVASCVHLGELNRGHIVDYFVDPKYLELALKALWDRALKFFKNNKVHYISRFYSCNDIDQLSNKFFSSCGMRKKVKVIDLIVLCNKNVVNEDYVTDIQNWSISMAFTEGRWG